MARSELCLLFFFFLSSFASASSVDGPLLIVHKKVDVSRLKSGIERLSISIDLYNQGSATAYDVSLADDSWTKDTFDFVTGSTSNSWERLDAGASVSHSFVLESKKKGPFNGAPALVKFRVPSKAALQAAYSTPIQPLDILAELPPEKKFEWAKRLLAKYGSLLSVLSIVGLFVYVVASPSKSTAAKSSKKKR